MSTHTIIGTVGTDPRLVELQGGRKLVSFRVAETQRRFDSVKNEWVDGDTNWLTAIAFGKLAEHATLSVSKGERVIITGRLQVRNWDDGNGKSGTNVEIVADGLGHDLAFGTTEYTRSNSGAQHGENAIDAAIARAEADAQALIDAVG